MDTAAPIGSATPGVSPGNYNPVTVTVNDSTGAVFLGVIALALLVAWLRSEGRYRALLAQLAADR